jgi:AmmeMemoRadiSam system protein B
MRNKLRRQLESIKERYVIFNAVLVLIVIFILVLLVGRMVLVKQIVNDKFSRPFSHRVQPTSSDYLDVSNMHLSDQFWPTIQQANKQPSQTRSLSGLVIPHHDLARALIADGIRRLEPQQPHLIIIVGPNHFFSDRQQILTTLKSWQTFIGPVTTDASLIEYLLEKSSSFDLIEIDDAVLANDHAVISSLPYIKYYLPKAKVIGFLMPYSLDLNQLRELANNIVAAIQDTGYEPHEVVVLGSVDFSHYLLPSEAEENDKFTLNLIQNQSWYQLMNLDDAFLDSPSSLFLSFVLAEKLGATDMEVFANTNSGYFLNRSDISSTSYFEIGFLK